MQKLSEPSLKSRSRAASRSRAISNPWLQYAEFFTNKSFLIPDTIAFNRILPYFKALPHFSSRYKISLVELVGYEAYFVEQWIASRSSNSLIVTYTGDRKNKIVAYHVVSTLASGTGNKSNPDEDDIVSTEPTEDWPPKFISYLVDQLESPFCVATETSLGYAFITNLTQLNPFLSLVNAKTGNIADDYLLFAVNYNFRKVGCGSRSAATTDEPTKSMEDKFKSIFKIDGKVPINYAGLNIVLIMQTFLYYYGMLDPLHCDGLLCEKTEKAIQSWWALIMDIPLAVQMIKVKPPSCGLSDSIQAIVGFTVMCRYLLEVGGNNFSVPKDPMDFKKLKPSILKFQKYFKLTETSNYDRETLLKLLEWGSNNKASQNITKDLSKMKKLVKNTVIDITSGKNLQSIAQSAIASPFHLYSHANYDKKEMINCQNIEQISHMSLGKQLTYLFFATGKPIDFSKHTLSIYYIEKEAESTAATSRIKDIKSLKNQISTQTLTSIKGKQTTNTNSGSNGLFDIKNISAATLNIFDKEQGNLKSAGSDKAEDVDAGDGNDDQLDEVDGHNGSTNAYKFEDSLNQKIRRNTKSRLTSLFSSDDELNEGKSHRKESLGAADYIEGYAADVNAYNPLQDSSVEGLHDMNNNRARRERESFSSQLKIKGTPFGMNTIDKALSGEVHQNETDFSNGGIIKNVHASPHAIYTEGFSNPGSILNSIGNKHSSGSGESNYPSLTSTKYQNRQNTHTSNEYESDGAYDYESGFEYDYEIDGQNENPTPKYHTKHNVDPDSKEHSRKSSTQPSVLPKDQLSKSTERLQNPSSSMGKSSFSKTNPEVDVQYLQFCNRIKRRHSIPIVTCEMNKYAIEMKHKKDKKERNILSGLDRRASWASSRRSVWDRQSYQSSYKKDDDSVGDQQKRNFYETQSIYTQTTLDSNYQSQERFIIHHKTLAPVKHRRSQSVSIIENNLISVMASQDLCLYNIPFAEFWTPEVLANKYLKIKDKYLDGVVEQTSCISGNLQRQLIGIIDSLSAEKNPATCVSLKYGSTRNDINKAFGRYFELEDKLKNATKSNARLKYELRLLLQKTKEVENNLQILEDFKIKTLHNKIQVMIGKFGFQNAKIAAEPSLVSANKSKDNNDASILNKMRSEGTNIGWESMNWATIWKNPYILIYFLFRLVFCLVLRRVDSSVVERRWKEIDKNQTVTAVIRDLYAKSMLEIQNLDKKNSDATQSETGQNCDIPLE